MNGHEERQGLSAAYQAVVKATSGSEALSAAQVESWLACELRYLSSASSSLAKDLASLTFTILLCG